MKVKLDNHEHFNTLHQAEKQQFVANYQNVLNQGTALKLQYDTLSSAFGEARGHAQELQSQLLSEENKVSELKQFAEQQIQKTSAAEQTIRDADSRSSSVIEQLRYDNYQAYTRMGAMEEHNKNLQVQSLEQNAKILALMEELQRVKTSLSQGSSPASKASTEAMHSAESTPNATPRSAKQKKPYRTKKIMAQERLAEEQRVAQERTADEEARAKQQTPASHSWDLAPPVPKSACPQISELSKNVNAFSQPST